MTASAAHCPIASNLKSTVITMFSIPCVASQNYSHLSCAANFLGPRKIGVHWGHLQTCCFCLPNTKHILTVQKSAPPPPPPTPIFTPMHMHKQASEATSLMQSVCMIPRCPLFYYNPNKELVVMCDFVVKCESSSPLIRDWRLE